jgi:hypothetical protein
MPPFTHVEIVVDVSASMSDVAPHTSDGKSKWDITRPVDYQPVLDFIEQAQRDESVKTCVLGLPGSEHVSFVQEDGRVWLSWAAELGGTSRHAGCQSAGPNYCHFDLSQEQDFEQALSAALESIVERVFPCRYPFPDDIFERPLDMSRLNTIYVPQTGDSDDWLVIPSTADCENGSGWYLDSTDGDYLMLCPKTCRVFRESYALLETFGECPALMTP